MEAPLCTICCKPLDDDVYTSTCCNQRALHESCMNQHAHYCRREFLKQHQNFDDFIVFCIFCKQDSGYVITQPPTYSIPESIYVSDVNDSGTTVSGFTSLIHAGESDTSYVPEEHVSDEDMQRIVDEVNADDLCCAVCAKLIHDTDDKIQFVCCSKYAHDVCHSVTSGILKKLDMRRSYRGAACIVCSSSRYMVLKDYTVCEEVEIIDGIHPMSASPSAHYMITRCVLYLHGFKFQEGNPWSLKQTFLKFPNLERELLMAKQHFVETPHDNEVLSSLVATTIGKIRNAFLDPDRALDILGRTPNTERLMYTIYTIYRRAKELYPTLAQRLLDMHVETVNQIDLATRNTIVHPPKHACMKPCCRTMCVEAHPIIRVPVVGDLPVHSGPAYCARSGPSKFPGSQPSENLQSRDKGLSSPVQVSVVQASCIGPDESPNGKEHAESPTKLDKREVLLHIIQELGDSPALPTITRTLVELGKMNAVEMDNDFHMLLKLVMETTDKEDLKLISTVIFGNKRMKRG